MSLAQIATSHKEQLLELHAPLGIVGPLPVPTPANPPTPVTQAADTISNLTKYIPTEVLTLWAATLSVLPALRQLIPLATADRVYVFYACLTPLLLFAIFLNSPGPAIPSWKQWPWTKMAAGVLAFLLWALTVPGNPFIDPTKDAASEGVVLVGAILLTTLLQYFVPIIDNKILKLAGS